MTGVLIAIAIVGGVGLFIGIFLGFAGEKFKVEIDPKEEAVLEALPGNNCGACGYPGCSGCAAAIARGDAPANQCPVGGAPVAEKVAEIMGVTAEVGDKKVAFVKCAGDCDKAKVSYNYIGVKDCNAAMTIQNGGPKACDYGCMGFGSCVEACEFDAIHVVNGIAVVDKEECVACGKCITACPKNLIEFVPYSSQFIVQCASKDKGKDVMKVCSAGCIGCGICEKNCPADAVHVVDNIAHINQDLCIKCGICAQKCPKKVIIGLAAQN